MLYIKISSHLTYLISSLHPLLSSHLISSPPFISSHLISSPPFIPSLHLLHSSPLSRTHRAVVESLKTELSETAETLKESEKAVLAAEEEKKKMTEEWKKEEEVLLQQVGTAVCSRVEYDMLE